MPDDLYERDALAWAEQQSELLRRLSVGEGVNARIDWPHVIEEVRDVGLAELHSCESLLTRALAHLLKLHSEPTSETSSHWRREARAFLAGARRRFTPSMRRRMDLAELYGDACDEVGGHADVSGGSIPFPRTCPVTLDELLARPPDLDGLLSRFTDHDDPSQTGPG